MASADLAGAVLTFLGDNGNTPGDLRNSINNEINALLGNGCVVVTRAGRSGQRLPRRDPATGAQVEIVLVSTPRGRVVGIGMQERDVVVDVKFTYTKKDTFQGFNQLTQAKDVARAVVARYDGMSFLTIPVASNLGTFRRSRAEVLEIDEIPDSSELIRSVVRLTFTFTEAMATNE